MTPVLLLHGIGGRASLWAPSVLALAPRRVVAFDMPGYDGASPAATDFPALADAAMRGMPRMDVVGHSLGGMLALEIALRHPARVRRLVLVASSAAFGARDPVFAETFITARQQPLDEGLGMAGVAAALVPTMLGPLADPGAAPAAIAGMASVNEAAYRATLRLLTGFDRRADLPRITQPTLLIAGGADATAPPRGMARMVEALPDARLLVLPGVGHLLPLEAPDAFHAALLGFLTPDFTA